MSDTPGTRGVPRVDVAALRSENGRLREANALLEDKDAKIAELEDRELRNSSSACQA